VERSEAASAVAAALAALPGVLTVALGGSEAAGAADGASDLDFYVYSDVPVVLSSREALAKQLAERGGEVGNDLWEPGDEWTLAGSGIPVDIMFRTRVWIEEQLDRVLVRHEPSLGYSTCFWHNVRTSSALYDRDAWYAVLQARAECPYPDLLRTRIVRRNYRVLRGMRSSYAVQLARAAWRRDRANLVDRAAAFLASYFDAVFAVNRVLHPGEKRQLEFAERTCRRLPREMGSCLDEFARAVGAPWEEQPDRTRAAVDALVDGLERMLEAEPDLVVPAAVRP
jgi:predicted nucleotidyltransferase